MHRTGHERAVWSRHARACGLYVRCPTHSSTVNILLQPWKRVGSRAGGARHGASRHLMFQHFTYSLEIKRERVQAATGAAHFTYSSGMQLTTST